MADGAPKFARKARRSMLDLSVGRQTTQNMNLRASKAKETTPFKAGKIKYDAPKYLSSAMTPPRKRKEIRSTSSASLCRKTQDRPSQEDPIQEESFEPTPIMLNINDIPFEPIHDSFETTYTENKENQLSQDEWMTVEAEKFIPEPLDENPLASVAEAAVEASEEEERDIRAELELVKSKLENVAGSHIYLTRKIPKIETMLEQTEIFSANDVLGAWDVLLSAIQKVLDRAEADLALVAESAEETAE